MPNRWRDPHIVSAIALYAPERFHCAAAFEHTAIDHSGRNKNETAEVIGCEADGV